MANPKQLRNLTSNLSFASALTALAIAFLLIAVAPQPAQAQTFKVLYTFTGGQDGGMPQAGLTMDGAGNLYGTAQNGGLQSCAYGCGTVFKLKRSASGWTYNPLYSFSGGSDGAYPKAGVIFGPDGSLYGTAFEGGNSRNDGVVFNLRPSPRFCKTVLCPWVETVLHQFAGTPNDGANPDYGDLIFDPAGNIYGATSEGGTYGGGTVYQLTASGGEIVLHSFGGSFDGLIPFNGVIRDGDGNLYGTTYQGGLSYNDGTVFQVTPSGTETVIYDFSRNLGNGLHPNGLIFDQLGNLYGTTPNGGSGQNDNGTVFELTLSNGSWTYSLAYSFTGGSDCGPANGVLLMDAVGNLYGTTYCSGAHGYGSVFKLTNTHSGWIYKSLHDFNATDGAWPGGNLIFDGTGNLYGTASNGGAYGWGVVWEITP